MSPPKAKSADAPRQVSHSQPTNLAQAIADGLAPLTIHDVLVGRVHRTVSKFISKQFAIALAENGEVDLRVLHRRVTQ